jgi:hypothetical protein
MAASGSSEIIDARLGTGLRQKGVLRSGGEQATHLAQRILGVSEMHAAGRTDRDTRGIQTLLDPMNAESALVGIALRMNEAGVVGTGGETSLAADTLVFVDQDHAATLVNMTRTRRAAGYARGIGAVVAALRPQFQSQGGPLAVHRLGDPIATVAFGDVVLRLAGHDAVHTADAATCIYNHDIA